MVAEINSENFEQEISQNSLTVVDFFADWCGPCRKMGPILEEVETELASKVKFAKINTDNNIEVAKKYQVSGLPTLMVFKNGEPVERLVGLMPKSSIITNIDENNNNPSPLVNNSAQQENMQENDNNKNGENNFSPINMNLELNNNIVDQNNNVPVRKLDTTKRKQLKKEKKRGKVKLV